MQKREAYKNILSDIIKEHMVLFDSQIALAIIHAIPSISFSNDGTVHDIKGNPEKTFNEIRDAYVALGGEISRNTINTITSAYPEYSL